MHGSGPKIKSAAIPSPIGTVPMTDAGRMLELYRVRQQVLPTLPAGPTPPRAPKLTAARVRMAREQAVLGVRLAQGGRLAQAIDRMRQSVDLDPTVASVQHDMGLALIRAGRLDDAVQALRRALWLDPNLASAHLHLATTFEGLARDADARAAYEALVRLDPTLHHIHACLAKIHLEAGRTARALDCLLAAASSAASAQSPRARIYQAHAEMAKGCYREAEALLRAVVAEDPDCGEAHVALGQVLAVAGQSREASACIERGIGLDPGMVSAWYQFATLTKFDASHTGQIARMEACLLQTELTLSQRQAVLFALGKACNDRGDYAAAIRHIDAANQIRGAHRKMDRALLARQTTYVIAATPRDFLDVRPDIGVDDNLPILIVGMPRSGTTLVEQILSCHPDVAPGGELTFWRERNRDGIPEFGAGASRSDAHRLAEAYLATLRSVSPDAARVTDKMPFNFAHLGVIRQLFPRATIVHCRRNPIDTCLSNYMTNFQVPYDFAADRGSLVAFYREYQRLMAHWRDVLPADHFIEVSYEALVADPEPISRTLVAACGLEWNDACLAPHQNDRAIATASLWQARQPIYKTSADRWRRYEPWLGELRELLNEPEHETLAKPYRSG